MLASFNVKTNLLKELPDTAMIEFIKKIFKKYREQITYLIFGGLTTLVSIAVSSLFYYVIFGKTHNILSNVISEIVAITFAYITNKLFVFCSKTNDFKSLLKEIVSFYLLRAASTLLNIGAMYLFVDIWHFEFIVCKIIVTVVVIILNYIFSKLFVFKKKNAVEEPSVTTADSQGATDD